MPTLFAILSEIIGLRAASQATELGSLKMGGRWPWCWGPVLGRPERTVRQRLGERLALRREVAR